MTKKLCYVLCASLFGVSAQASDLLDIYGLALQADAGYRAAAETRRATLEAKPQALAFLLPQLNFSADYTDVSQDITKSSFATTGPRDFDDTALSVRLDQVIYRADFFTQLKQADSQVAQAEIDFQSARQDLIIRTATAYFDVLAAIDNLTFLRAEKKAIAQQLNQTKQRFNVGLTAITDVHESQARYDQAVAAEIAGENDVAVARESLRVLTGKMPGELATLNDDLPLVYPEPNNVEAWVNTAMAQSLPLLSAQKTVDIARDEVSRQRAGHYPTLDLAANYDYSDRGGVFAQESNETRIGVRLNVPIYSGGATSSVTRQASFNFGAAQENLELVRRETERQARSAYLTVLANISGVKALKQVLVSSTTALEATEAGFEVGTRTAVEVLNSQQELYRAASIYARARYDYLLQTLLLKQAAGTLQDADLQQINRWLQ
jgi:outer membrane protein